MKSKKFLLSIWRSFTTSMKAGFSIGHCGKICLTITLGWINALRMFYNAFSTIETSAFPLIYQVEPQESIYLYILSGIDFMTC